MKRIDRNNLLWVAGYIAIIALLIWIRPNPVDWTPTYDHKDDIPFGIQLPYQVLKHQLSPEEISMVDSSIADIDQKLKTPANIIIIDQFVHMDEYETDSLLNWIHRGGTALMISEGLADAIIDTLGITTKVKFVSNINTNDSLLPLQRSTELSFVAGQQVDTFTVYLNWSYNYFIMEQDSSDFKNHIRGLSYNLQGDPVFIKIQIGQGFLYLHSMPEAFTNYQYLQRDGRAYVDHCLSVLPKQHTYWDDYHKSYDSKGENRSLLRVIGHYPSLNTAWYLLLFTLAVYLFLSGRRRQRIIPEWHPKQNQSKEYAKTLGDLYYKNAQPQAMLMKRIQTLQLRLHQDYHFQNIQFNEEEIPSVARKTGIEQNKLKQLWRVIREVRKDHGMTTQEFIEYNALFSQISNDLK